MRWSRWFPLLLGAALVICTAGPSSPVAGAQSDPFIELMNDIDRDLGPPDGPIVIGVPVDGDEFTYAGEPADPDVTFLGSAVITSNSDVVVSTLWQESTIDERGVAVHPRGYWMAAGNTVPPPGSIGDFVIVALQLEGDILAAEFGDVGVYASTPDGVPYESPFEVDPNDGSDISWNLFRIPNDRAFVQGWEHDGAGNIVANNDDQGFAIGNDDGEVLFFLPQSALPPGSNLQGWVSDGNRLDRIEIPDEIAVFDIGGEQDADETTQDETDEATSADETDQPDDTTTADDQEEVSAEETGSTPAASADDEDATQPEPGDQEVTQSDPAANDEAEDDDGGGGGFLLFGGIILALALLGGGWLAWSRRSDADCDTEYQEWQAALERTARLAQRQTEAQELVERRTRRVVEVTAAEPSATRVADAQRDLDVARRDLDEIDAELERERQNAAEWQHRYDVCRGAVPDDPPQLPVELDAGGTAVATGTGTEPEPDDGDDPRDVGPCEGGPCTPDDPAPAPEPIGEPFKHASLTIRTMVTSTEAGYRRRDEAAQMAADLDELKGRLDTAGNLTPRAGYGLAVKIGLEILEGTAGTGADLARMAHEMLESHEVKIVEVRMTQVAIHLQWTKVWVCRDGRWMCERRLHVIEFERKPDMVRQVPVEGRPDLAEREVERLVRAYQPRAEQGRAAYESYLRLHAEGPCPC